MNIEDYIKPILEKFDVESYSFKQQNKIGSLTFFINEPWSMNHYHNSDLTEMVKKLDIIHTYYSSYVRQGKKTENKNKYVFSFSLKKEFFNGKINMGHYYGQMLNLVKEKDIKTKEDFFRVATVMIKNMSDFTHTLKFREKAKYREIKSSFIQGLYDAGFIESLSLQMSYCDDSLVLFQTKFGQSFHLRKTNCWFVPSDLPKHPSIYMKREIDVDKIDMDFMNYVSLLKHVYYNPFVFINSEILN